MLARPFKLAADHLVQIHEQVNSLRQEILVAEHIPSNQGFVSLGFEGKFRLFVAAKGLKNSSWTLTRSLGRLSVIVIRPSPTSLLPTQL
jgi:hypothetical protein